MNNTLLLRAVRDLHIDPLHFSNGDIRAVGVGDYRRTDSTARDHFTYPEWVESYQTFPVVKVEKLEQYPVIRKQFAFLNPVDIHLFKSLKTGFSFKWHQDFLNVFLYVLKGQKRVELKNKVIVLNPGQGCYIPYKHYHRVLSKKGTVALSVGYR